MRSAVCLLSMLLAPIVNAQSSAVPKASVATTAAATSETAAPPKKPLDLRVGQLRRYLPPGDAAKLQADRPPVSSIETVIIEGNREKIPDRINKPIPGGPFGAIFYSLTNPTKAWRVLVPGPNAPPAPPPRSDAPPQVPRIGCGPGTNRIFCD